MNFLRRQLCNFWRLEFPVRQNLTFVRLGNQHALLAPPNLVAFRVFAKIDIAVGIRIACITHASIIALSRITPYVN